MLTEIMLRTYDFFNLSPNMLWLGDLEAKSLELNQVWEKNLGWTPAELLGKTVLSFVHPEDLAAVGTQLAQCAKDEERRVFEMRFRNNQGEYHWLRWTAKGDLGKRSIIAIAMDISEQKAAQVKIKEQMDLMHLIIQAVPMGITLKEVGEKIKWVIWSRGMEELVNVVAANAVGKTNDEVYPADTARQINHLDRLCLEKGATVEENQIPTTVEGRGARVFRTRKIPLMPDERGRFRFLLSVVEDITELKLVQKQAIYNAYMASLATMAGGVAHEINNPLGILAGKIRQIKTMLRKEPVPWEQIDRHYEVVEQTIERITNIVSGLRLYAAAEANKNEHETVVAEVIADILALCSDRFKHSEVVLDIDCEPGLILPCRRSEAAQMLLNLLANAHDAAVDGEEKWVKLSAARVGPEVVLTVVDSGKGIHADLVDVIMLPFFTTKPIGQGTGLGLSITKGLVEAHQGRLIHDRSAAQTTFIIALPAPGAKAAAEKLAG